MSGAKISEYGLEFCGGRPIALTHFVYLGKREGREFFAFGYWKTGNVYTTGFVAFESDGEFAFTEMKTSHLLPEKGS